MNEEGSADLESAAATLRDAETVNDLLRETARTLVDVLGADACTISRAIGDLLIDLVDHVRGPHSGRIQLGHGYLISDYRLTREVLERRESRTVSLDDPQADRSEAQLLRDLGFDALLMLPLEQDATTWGLTEVYTVGRGPFGEDAVERGSRIVAEAGRVLSHLLGG